MNIKYNYHVHKYDTRGSHDLLVSVCRRFLYHNVVFNMGIKLCNKLLKNEGYTHLTILNRKLQLVFLQNVFYTVG
jgi:hypothetical protein